ncbi:hypothetical protein [Brevundimonas aurifodinae]|uniref:Uncharacterized protein n=2 Tax=Brevundimonas TaxID=41275 RepID=A0ABV1NKE5_9CAUL|nr:MAG: hypothetical protein B7Z42_04345 [Brevundimonas sp. 12-68-7]OYX35704.1 MAG: hypothetical protein B7Z01_02085 [Brevundimonas subvibrioides]
MLASLAVLLLTAAAPVKEVLGPDPRLAAFQQFCLPHRLDPAAMISGFEQGGWSLSAADANPELAAVTQLDQDRASEAEATSETTILRRDNLFATVNVLTAEIAQDETARYGTCAIWDFDAAFGIPDQQASSLSSAESRIRLDQSYGRIVQWDLSSALPGAGNLQTSYFPEGSPAAVQTGFTGTAVFLTSDLGARPH